MVAKLVDAAGLLDCIFWRQSDPEGLKLYLSLANSTNPQDKMLRELSENQRRPLRSDRRQQALRRHRSPCRPAAASFPQDMTRANFDAYVAAHPDQKAALLHDRRRCVSAAKATCSRPVPVPRGLRRISESDGEGPPRSRAISATIPPSRTSCACAPMRCSPTTTTRATSPGSISRIRNST